MFERFTDRARRVVVLSQEAARELEESHIGTEHLLLALIREEEGIAAKALAEHNVTQDKVLSDVRYNNSNPHVSTGHIPFTPRCKKALELGLRESHDMGHNYIGTEHLLLAIIRGKEGGGCAVLELLGVDFDRLRDTVKRKIAESELDTHRP